MFCACSSGFSAANVRVRDCVGGKEVVVYACVREFCVGICFLCVFRPKN